MLNPESTQDKDESGGGSKNRSEGAGQSSAKHAITDAGLMSGIVTKRWRIHFERSDSKEEHTVAIRHSPLDGFRYVLVDGTEVKGSEGIYSYSLRSWFSGQSPPPDTVTLDFDNGPRVTMQIIQASDRFLYTCTADGKPIIDTMREVFSKEAEDDCTSKYIVTIPDVEIFPGSEESDSVAWYTMYVIRRRGGLLTKCRRRYRHFYELNSDVLSTFASSHLQSAVPPFPARSWKWLTDHTSPDFIELRRAELENYMQKLVRVPHVDVGPDFLGFTNMWLPKRVSFALISMDGVKKREIGPKLASMHVKLIPGEFVHFFASGPLGIVLRCNRPTDLNADIVVQEYKQKDAASKEGRGRTPRGGDRLTRVNGREVKGRISYKEAIAAIRRFRARHGGLIPLALHFCRSDASADGTAEGGK
eukprot:g783.t1